MLVGSHVGVLRPPRLAGTEEVEDIRAVIRSGVCGTSESETYRVRSEAGFICPEGLLRGAIGAGRSTFGHGTDVLML